MELDVGLCSKFGIFPMTGAVNNFLISSSLDIFELNKNISITIIAARPPPATNPKMIYYLYTGKERVCGTFA